MIILAITTQTFAQEPPKSPPKNGWRERLALREKQFVEVQEDIAKIKAMVSEIYQKELGMQKFYELMLEENDEPKRD
jgi:hypothetical protein